VARPYLDELSTFIGSDVEMTKGISILTMITAYAKSYTRGQGFTDGEPSEDIQAVILTASARLLADTSQITQERSMGPFRTVYRSGFDGFSTGELAVLNRYRVRAM